MSNAALGVSGWFSKARSGVVWPLLPAFTQASNLGFQFLHLRFGCIRPGRLLDSVAVALV